MRTAKWTLAAILLATACPAEEPAKRRLAVLDLDYGIVRSQVAAIFGTDVDVGRGMRDVIVRRLVEDGLYVVVDLSAPAPVDAIVTGSVTLFGGDAKDRTFTVNDWFGAGLQTRTVRAVVAVDLRIVNVDTGEVVAVAEGRGESKRAGSGLLAGVVHKGSLNVGAVDFTCKEFETTILGEAVKAAALNAAAALAALQKKIPSREAAGSAATEIVARVLAREAEKRKAFGDGEEATPSGADLRLGRTVFIHPMPYDLHRLLAEQLAALKSPLLVVSGSRRDADLWLRGEVTYVESAPFGFLRADVMLRRVNAAVEIVARGGGPALWNTAASGDARKPEGVAKKLVKNLEKAMRAK